jgi:hypothetical protein
MLRTLAVALLAIAMSVGLAQAKMHKHMPGCIVGQPATATCLCGVSFTVNQCCARRGNGVIGNGVSARRKAFYTDKGGKQLTQGPPLHCAGRQRAKTWFMSNMKASREGHHESQTAYNFGILGNSHCRCNSLVVYPVPLIQGHEDQLSCGCCGSWNESTT